MIAIAETAPKTKRCSQWHAGFLAMMPAIARHAGQAFHYLDAEARAEAVQDVLASAMSAYVRLCQRGKVDLAYPSVLARYAVAQYRDGRRVGEKMNCRDVLSPYAQQMKGIQVESLNGYNRDGEPWREILVEDKHAGPAETAAARIDVGEWFASMKRGDRMIAEALTQGATTNDVAKQFHVSPGRISQKRREFLESWQALQSEQEEPAEENLLG